MKVWVLLFDDVNLDDCSGVFSTKEKALEAFQKHCERCSDIWLDVKKEDEGENWITFSFKCIIVENTHRLVGVLIQEETVDAL